MLPERRIPTHPGVMLIEEFLKPKGESQSEFARRLGIPLQRVNEIVKGKRGVTADTAWKFALALGTTPQFWMNLQSNRDLAISRPNPKARRFGAKRAARATGKAAASKSRR